MSTEEKEEYADKVLDFLEEWGMSGLRDSMEVCHIFTPDDFESQLNATDGNAFALEPKLTQTAWFRPHNRSEDFENLYFVGAGTHPGAGLPGVLSSSIIVQDLIGPAHSTVKAPRSMTTSQPIKATS